MAASLIIEEESGTCKRAPRAHNGYYAGDFSHAPMLTDAQFAALAVLRGTSVQVRVIPDIPPGAGSGYIW